MVLEPRGQQELIRGQPDGGGAGGDRAGVRPLLIVVEEEHTAKEAGRVEDCFSAALQIPTFSTALQTETLAMAETAL